MVRMPPARWPVIEAGRSFADGGRRLTFHWLRGSNWCPDASVAKNLRLERARRKEATSSQDPQGLSQVPRSRHLHQSVASFQCCAVYLPILITQRGDPHGRTERKFT